MSGEPQDEQLEPPCADQRSEEPKVYFRGRWVLMKDLLRARAPSKPPKRDPVTPSP
jgi:hypothetical protein